MSNTALIHEILSQILMAAQRIERRSTLIQTPDDFLNSEEGVDKLDGICMMLIAIGESLKNLDKITDGALLQKYPEIDWKGAKGVRDIISHHYFDLNAEAVFGICRKHIPALILTTEKMIQHIDNHSA